MKHFIAFVFTLVSFLSVAVFGFLIITHNNHHQGCIAAAANGGVVCPPQSNDSLPLAFFHLNILKKFGRAIFSSTPSFDLSKLFLLSASPSSSLLFIFLPVVVFFALVNQQKESISFAAREKFIHWLSLKIKEPSF